MWVTFLSVFDEDIYGFITKKFVNFSVSFIWGKRNVKVSNVRS